MRPSEVIQNLQATNSRLEKEDIVEQAWNEGCIDFFVGAKLCYDSLITFGVKQVPDAKNTITASVSRPFAAFCNLAGKLQNRQLTGYAARDAIQDFADSTNEDDWNYFYKLILIKDFKAGLSETTINKVLKKISGAALDYIVPTFTCQLAFDCEDKTKKFENKVVYVEPKLDGVRIIAVCDKQTNAVTLYTRNGKQNDNFPHIVKQLEQYTKDIFTESYVVDGEVTGTNFQELMTQTNRKSNNNTTNTVFNMFDLIPLEDFKVGYCKQSQQQRKVKLWDYILNSNMAAPHSAVNVVVHDQIDLSTEEGKLTFEKYKEKAVADGYEGIMIKMPNAPYEGKRTEAWLKFKPYFSFDLYVVAFEEGTGRNKGRLGDLICQGTFNYIGNGSDQPLEVFIQVSVGSGLTDAEREEIWNNREKYMGVLAEIEADAVTKSKKSDSYSLRFPRFKCFRYDK